MLTNHRALGLERHAPTMIALVLLHLLVSAAAASPRDAGPDCMTRAPLPSELLPAADASILPSGDDPWRIVLRFLILRRADGTGGVTDTELFHDMMRDLNYGFRDTPFVFVNLPDIEYVDNDAWYTLNTVAEAHALMNAYEEPGVANIFFSDQLLFDAFQARGYTSATNPRGHIFGDVVGLPYATPYPPHEIGHLFWLFHPYETQFGLECVSGSNCSSRGDLVCDTPASMGVFNGNTTATGIYYAVDPGPCAGDPIYAPRTDLIMESGWAPGHAGYMYRDAFSDGQIVRMGNTLLNFSSDLIGAARPDVLVDCDGDLVDDVEEILAGLEDDANHDLVPDRCQVTANEGDLLVSGMHQDQTNRPRYFDGTTGEWRGDLWSGAWWTHQFRLGPEGYVYMPSLTVIQRLSFDTGRLVDNFVDGVLEGAQVFVDLLFDDAGDLLVLDNITRNIRRYSGVDGSYLGDFASLPAGMTSPKYMEYGPDGHIYVVGNGGLGNTIQKIDRASGAQLGSFIFPGAGGLGAGQGLRFHDGMLYVSNGSQNDVLRYDATTGQFIDVFVASNSGGLSNPHCLAFDDDGHLYVASRNTHSVKRYDGTSGAYLGDFVAPGAGGPSGSGGVMQPTGLLFVPARTTAVADAAPAPRTPTASPGVPNPFRSSIRIDVDLPEPAPVTVRVYDVRGRLVRTLEEGRIVGAGPFRSSWDGMTDDGGRAAAGVYFYEVEAGALRSTQRAVLLR